MRSQRGIHGPYGLILMGSEIFRTELKKSRKIWTLILKFNPYDFSDLADRPKWISPF